MKKIITTLILVSLGMSFQACYFDWDEDEQFERLPYFKFEKSDADLFINFEYKIGGIVNFIDNSNDSLSFRVKKSEMGKSLYSERKNGLFGSSSKKHFYYDKQEIILYPVDLESFQDDLRFSLYRWPKEIDRSVYPTVISYDSSFLFYIGFSAFWNSQNAKELDYSQPVLSITLNDKHYHNVWTIELDFPKSFNENWRLPSVQFIYFQKNVGIVGFEDFENNIWTIDN